MEREIPENLTRRDKDILHILWDSDESMTASQIVSQDAGLTVNTVQAVLRKLLKCNLVEVDKIVYSGTVLSRSYRPVISEVDFEISGFCGRLGKMKRPFPVSSVMEALLGTADASWDVKEEINKMEEMLEKYKRENME